MLVDFIIKIIKAIILALGEITRRFVMSIIYIFIFHTKKCFAVLFAFLLMLTQVHQSKYGIFYNYNETIINNHFRKPCKVTVLQTKREDKEQIIEELNK